MRISIGSAICLVLSIVACGGGGGGNGSSSAPNQAPTAQAGENQQVEAGQRVTLSGSGSDSDGSIASYSWVQESGDQVTLDGADTATAQFDMPERPQSESLVFTLTVTDNDGLSASDSVTIEHQNLPPVVSAGDDKGYRAGSTVTLSGSAEDSDGNIESYSWRQNSGDSVSIVDADSTIATFTMPSQPTTENFEFVFTAVDNRGGESSDSVIINYINTPPSVSAGADQEALAGQSITLSGSASDSDGSIVSYSWTQEAGDEVILDGADTAIAQFQMPQSPVSVSLVFNFTVTDDGGSSASDSITINHQNAPPTVSVQSGSIATVGTMVDLIGEANDTDGEIASYQWTQTGGATVELVDADSPNASFVVPASDEPTSLSFTLTVTDNRGATASASITIGTSVTLEGKVTFDLVPLDNASSGLDYENIRITPARGVLVELIDASNNVFASTTTDPQGDYTFSVDYNKELRVRVSSRLLRGNIWDVKVADNTNGGLLYAGQGELFSSGTQDLTRNLHFESGWSGDGYGSERPAAPFAILDPIYDAMEKFFSTDTTLRFPALEIYWSSKNSSANGSVDDGDIGTSYYQGGKIYLLGKADADTDEYDRHVVIHEWGHYFEDKLSRTDSIGGSHGDGDKLDFRVAFSEGWSNAVSGIVTDDPFYRDSFGQKQRQGFSVGIEDNEIWNPGWYSRGSIQSIIYDLYDEQNDGLDTIVLGLGPIYQVLVSEAFKSTKFFTSIYSFIDELKNQMPESGTTISGLVEGQDIMGTGSDGAGETNDGGVPSSLPVYRKIEVNAGTPDKFCTVATTNGQNKLGNSVFITFEVVTEGEHTFSAVTATGSPSVDVDFLIYRSGTLVGVAEGTEIGQEQLTVLLQIGSHAMTLYGYDTSEDTCFELSVTR